MTGNDLETARLAATKRYGILDTPPDAMFDDIAEIARRTIKCPIAVISFVDKSRIWLKSHPGLPGIDELARDAGFCATAVAQDDPWVIENAAIDPRTLANPLVAGEAGLRFYAGIPLRAAEGYNLGMIAVLDVHPRAIADDEIDILKRLARIIVHLLEVRLDQRLASRSRGPAFAPVTYRA